MILDGRGHAPPCGPMAIDRDAAKAAPAEYAGLEGAEAEKLPDAVAAAAVR